jgi:hypothetical protein
MRLILLLLVLAISLPSAGFAQAKKGKDAAPLVQDAPEDAGNNIYSWVDGRGGWHFVDSLDLVPARFKAQAKANATRVNRTEPAPRLATAAAPAAAPPPKPIHTPATQLDMTPGERTLRVRQLQRRLGELESEIAVLEEGSVPNSYVEAAGSEEALTEAKLGELLSRTEQEITEIRSELDTLNAD